MTSSPLPVIDLRRAANPDGLRELAIEIDRACRDVGFLSVIGHGIPAATFDAVYSAMSDLVASSAEVKHSLLSPSDHPFRGWRTYTNDDGSTAVERLQVNHFDDAEAALAAGIDEQYADYFVPNVWPPADDAKAAWVVCFDEMRAVGDQLMGLFAVALGLERNYFASVLDRDVSTFAVNAYPAQTTADGDGPAVIFREHSDSGTLTVLHQRGDYAGLQILTVDGTWVAVPVDPEALTINIGDLMARWTNDRWTSTAHRVVASDDPAASRASITTFHLPNVDAVVEPLEPCLADEDARYDPVRVYDWEAQFLARIYTNR